MNNPLFKPPTESLTPQEEEQVCTELAGAYQACEQQNDPQLACKIAQIIDRSLNEATAQGIHNPYES